MGHGQRAAEPMPSGIYSAHCRLRGRPQQQTLKPRQAGFYAAAFTLGLFITIAVIGIVCAMLGRMLGDVGNWWQILIGLILVWVALGMLDVEKCSMSSSLLYRFNLRGLFGAFSLGLAYGVLSGSCTFGFIAPILAIITVQQKTATGVLFIFLFAVGHFFLTKQPGIGPGR